MKPLPAIFVAAGARYVADDCSPLKRAARAGEVTLAARGRGHYPGRPLPARVAPEVRSFGWWDARRDQRWGLDWHRNEGIEFTYVSRGGTPFSVDGRDLRLGRGDLTVTRPWQTHRVGAPRVTASRLSWLILDVQVRRPHQRWVWPDWVVLSRDDRARLTRLLQHNETPAWRADAAVAACFRELDALAASARSAGLESRIKLCVNGLLVALLDLLQRKRIALDASLSTSRRTAEIFLRELPRHAGEPWTLEAMARQCGLGRTRFAALCREVTNRSPVQYLADCRIAAAKRRLVEDPSAPVTAVAFDCGFQSSQYFATVFRRTTGHSPRTYRRRVQEKPLIHTNPH